MASLVAPTLLLAVAMAAHLASSQGLLNLSTPLPTLLVVALWITGTFFAARLAVLLTRRSFERRTRRQPPRLVADIVNGALWIGGLCALAVIEFGVSPTAAIATSGVVIAVIGFAVRSLVADLFYGITMAIDRPFELGDWVRLSDGSVGRVVEMTWRAVKLVTRENLKLIVPNTKLAVEQIANYDQPEPFWRKSQMVVLGYDVKPEQVRELLRAAVAEVPQSAAVPREAEALMIGWTEQGIEWELRYWLPDFASAAEVGQHVREAFLRNMTFSGIRVPRHREEVFVAGLDDERAQEQSSSASWIEQVALFAVAPPDARLRLQSAACARDFASGADIVRQGEAGSSLFVIQHGTCDVLIGGESGAERVGAIGAGAVFGELSLLTGAPRSATVRAATNAAVFEISKADLAPLLEQHPELATKFATVLADRRLADAHRDRERSSAQLEAERAGLISSLVDGARSFFQMRS